MIMSEIDLPTLSKWVVTWVGGGSGVHYGMRLLNSLSLSRSLASISSGNTIPDKHALSFSLSRYLSLSLSIALGAARHPKDQEHQQGETLRPPFSSPPGPAPAPPPPLPLPPEVHML